MNTLQYQFSPNIFGSVQVVSLVESGVVSLYQGNATVLPYERITDVRLWFDPTRSDAQRFRCEVRGTPGLSFTFQSTTCAGVGNFTPQSAAYRALIKDLHQHIARVNPHVKYVTGVSGLSYAFNVGCLGIGLGGLVLLILVFGAAVLGPGVIVPLILIVLCIPMTWRWLRRNRPKSYDPHAIPDELLPPGETVNKSSTSAGPPPLPAVGENENSKLIECEVNRYMADHSMKSEPPPGGGRWYTLDDFGPIAEPGDDSWCSVAGTTTHWADATRYAEEANQKLKAGLIGPPLDPPPRGEQPLRQ